MGEEGITSIYRKDDTYGKPNESFKKLTPLDDGYEWWKAERLDVEGDPILMAIEESFWEMCLEGHGACIPKKRLSPIQKVILFFKRNIKSFLLFHVILEKEAKRF